jgi:hypothetical protein
MREERASLIRGATSIQQERYERNGEMETKNDRSIDAGLVAPGEYAPAGEAQGEDARFSAEQIAHGFEVAIDRVHRALAGEFGLDADGRVDSRQAQHLAEVILGDQPLAEQEAALMRVGAFTPRPDHGFGIGETPPGEESDKLEPAGS